MGFDWGSHFWHSVFIWATGIAALFGGIGVMAAFVAGMVGYQITEFSLETGRKDQRLANLEISKAHESTAKLAAEAESSRAAIADANARALEARLELEKFKAPRVLSPEQQKSLTDKMSTFSGMKFDTAAVQDGEPIALLLQIEDALIAAGWSQLPWKGGATALDRVGRVDAGIVGAQGIIIQIDAKHAGALSRAARSLVDALRTVGFAAQVQVVEVPSSSNDAVHIAIGRKI